MMMKMMTKMMLKVCLLPVLSLGTFEKTMVYFRQSYIFHIMRGIFVLFFFLLNK